MDKIDTPLVDAAEFHSYSSWDGYCVRADFARTLERELSASQERVRELEGALCDLGMDTAEAGEYESEYDGRTYTFCLYCNYQDDVRPEHSADCPTRTARAALKEKS